MVISSNYKINKNSKFCKSSFYKRRVDVYIQFLPFQFFSVDLKFCFFYFLILLTKIEISRQPILHHFFKVYGVHVLRSKEDI